MVLMAGFYLWVTKLPAQAVIVWLHNRHSVRGLAKVMRLDWHMVNAIMRAAVERELQRREAESIEHLAPEDQILVAAPLSRLAHAARLPGTLPPNLRTSKAWRLKETIAGFWNCSYQGAAKRFSSNGTKR